MSTWNFVGYLASGLVIAAFYTKSMIPLRIVAICSNFAFFAYGIRLGLEPVWLLHLVLLPLNGWRLWQASCTKSAGHRADNERGGLYDLR